MFIILDENEGVDQTSWMNASTGSNSSKSSRITRNLNLGNCLFIFINIFRGYLNIRELDIRKEGDIDLFITLVPKVL